MYPILFSLGPIKIETYYILWGIALCLMLLWTRHRADSFYGIPFDDASEILLWVLAGVFIGASLGGYFDNWRRFAEKPALILRFWESGLSSGPGFIGGGLAGLYKIRRLGVSVDAFAESASLPCAAMLFVGRWGCFLNGCCVGIPATGPLGVRFPQTPQTAVYPTQLFESFAALCIVCILWIMERRLKPLRLHTTPTVAYLWPAFLILYGGYRAAFDFLRAGDRIFGLRVGQYTGLLALCIGVAWLCCSLQKGRQHAA